MLGAQSAFWRLSAWSHQLAGTRIEQIDDPDLGLVLVDSDRGRVLVAYGEPARGIDALRNVMDRGVRPDRTMINRELYGALDAPLRDHFGPNWGYAWDYFWADEPLDPVPGSERVELLRAASPQFAAVAGDVRRALEQANPITDALERFDELDWFVMRAPTGDIAIVLGATQEKECMSLEGLGTVPEYRGQGYGGATMVGAVNMSLELTGYVRFGVWSWNEGAMRLYRRLGIHHDGKLISGRREPFDEARYLQ
ncbi:GNAT family N-acetyltransferase [Trueperella bialowiezensis]|uniref:Acetyltransferase (GNAT) family n=1 Tax=Trueperella bialowiezensis TaxID=312285 RepID=A0A3S4WF33_9ACTO|nr:GNAT family N-acetyltransferase [Trueperella bialowiezensis]VEI12465.1 Acetyltransferase (GNAT) family [Trueperella bialowiezensis]